MKLKIIRQVYMMSKFALYGIFLQSIFASMLLAEEGRSQNIGLDKIYITLDCNDKALKDVFKNIETQTEFSFLYHDKSISKKRISTRFDNSSLMEILQEISKNEDLKFKRINGNIFVSEKENQEQAVRDIVELENFQNLIKGSVKSADDNQPLPGVSILIKGTTTGTTSDFDGNYSLNASDGATLQFSYIGFVTQEVEVTTQSVIDISLQPDLEQLEEVVVVGYGTQKRSDVTGSVSSVPKDRLTNLPVTNLMHAIQGTTAGLNITQNSSVPGSESTIQVRGVNSINANTSPFIVLDGIPFFGTTNDINPNDIKSIEILKDASAVAIYGTRGANGVILITTKRGADSDGKPKINYSGYGGVESIAHKLTPMSPDAYVQKYADYMEANSLAQTAILPNASEVENYNDGVTTDWLDETTQTGVLQEHNLNISGGTENIQYYVSLGRLDQKGVVKGYQFQRTNIRTNIDAKVNKYLKVGTSVFFTDNNYDGGRVNFLEATAMSPYSVPYDENGEYIIYPMEPEQLFKNPLLGLTTERVDRKKNLTGSGYAEFTPGFIDGLKYRLNGSYIYNINRYATYTGRAANDQSGTAYVSNSETANWVIENILTYNKDIEKHHFDVTALYSAQKVDYIFTDAQSKNFTNDALLYYNMSAGNTHSNNSSGNSYSLLSQMGRINYSYDSRYLFTFTARRDGYSAFGANTSKYGLFPSMALGWNISNENFMNNVPIVDNLKLRLSIGQSGNQAIGVNQTASIASTVQQPFGGSALTGVLYNTLGNADLNWETTTSANLALDFGLIQSRISGTVEVYKTKTKDILLERSLPTITGYDDVWANLGEMQNVGFELTLKTVNIEKPDFEWQTSLNFSTYKNKLLDLYGDGQDDLGNAWFIGQPLRIIYDYEKTGIWQEGEDIASSDPVAQAGDLKFKDQDGDGQITADDKVVIGQRDPKWIGGLTNTFRYKNFHLSVFLQVSHGGLRSNRDLTYADEAWRRNLPEDYGYWTPENQDNYWPSLAAYKNYRGYQFAEDYSYVRIKDVRLSYVFPSTALEKMGIGGLTVYAAGRNLYTFTDWFGWDPEMSYSSRGSDGWTNNYPLVRTFSLGLNLSL
ncbi:SusC/RagA family TonB-linked outer membrane protein [Chondrinema litorale]|uniref:SusC/RagA family TonB-linked outer membrane protein n=1 Tax=Chondrinema litorale TaxID=2994555 RepID=UPI002543D477|nr:SusC/RagA family TonB-linked outer membrane protein [Chondrinema litorale]UZR96273.1 SusC/RagA family TonB-linked outer membrane protein [Chondrinema litorale]